jgi:hypothetical protein
MIRHKINDEELFKYDYIGAPWPPGSGWARNAKYKVGNGGFSLRRVSAMLEITASRENEHGGYPEDEFFAEKTKNLPTEEIAARFANEYVPSPDPVGFHGIWRAGLDEMLRLIPNTPGLPDPEV